MTFVTLFSCPGCDLLPVPGEAPTSGGKATSPLKTGSARDHPPSLSCGWGEGHNEGSPAAGGKKAGDSAEFSSPRVIAAPRAERSIVGVLRRVVTRLVCSVALGLGQAASPHCWSSSPPEDSCGPPTVLHPNAFSTQSNRSPLLLTDVRASSHGLPLGSQPATVS